MAGAPIERVVATAHRLHTEGGVESDGTLSWSWTTMVLVRVHAGAETGIGYSYTDASAADLVNRKLAELVVGTDALAVRAAWETMARAVRNLGRPGIAASAISAVDTALWDLKGKLLGVPLADLWGRVRPSVPAYGSGGFTSAEPGELRAQLAGFVDQGLRAVKMKVGRDPARDPERVRQARIAVGDAELMVDANGALSPRQAVAFAERAADHGVTWFEEPVVHTDRAGLAFVREHAPATMEIATGEYGWEIADFLGWIGAVDVLQVDATRCLGFTGLLEAAALCDAHHVPLSTHTAPALHVHVGCALPGVRHVEWFVDHVRLESQWFDGFPELLDGRAIADPSRSGLGLVPREDALSRHRIG